MVNKKVLIVLICLLGTLAGCEETRSVDELRKLFDGVFYLDAKRIHEPSNSLHYIVFYQDSTYVHKYIVDGDTLNHKGAWEISRSKRSGRLHFYLEQWIPYGNDPIPLKEGKKEQVRIPGLLLGNKTDDWAGLRFDIDGNYDFIKIGRMKASELGIKE